MAATSQQRAALGFRALRGEQGTWRQQQRGPPPRWLAERGPGSRSAGPGTGPRVEPARLAPASPRPQRLFTPTQGRAVGEDTNRPIGKQQKSEPGKRAEDTRGSRSPPARTRETPRPPTSQGQEALPSKAPLRGSPGRGKSCHGAAPRPRNGPSALPGIRGPHTQTSRVSARDLRGPKAGWPRGPPLRMTARPSVTPVLSDTFPFTDPTPGTAPHTRRTRKDGRRREQAAPPPAGTWTGTATRGAQTWGHALGTRVSLFTLVGSPTATEWQGDAEQQMSRLCDLRVTWPSGFPCFLHRTFVTCAVRF